MNHLAFISHSHMYFAIAQEICSRLKENGIASWVAPRDIVSDDWAESIMKGIARSDIFIPVVGEHSVNSVECLKELTEATRSCTYIIPFKVDNSELSLSMQYHLGPFHWLDASKPPLEKRIDELVHRVLHISDEEAVYINANRLRIAERIEYPKESFTGRDSELNQIAEHFAHEHVLFIQGMGGIGKSEVAKKYAEQFRERYDTIVFTRYISGLQELFCSDEILIENLKRSNQESRESWYQRKMNAFRKIVDSRTLLIIDNFDADNDPCLDDILNCPCHILLTTRNNHSDYPVMHIGHIHNIEHVRSIFKTYYDRPVRNWDDIDEILRLVNFHTITVELIAKQMKASFMTPDRMLKLLKNTGMNLPLKESVQMKGSAEKHNSYYYIRQLFECEGLSDEKKRILMCMSLVPPSGVEVTLLGKILELDSYDAVNGLIDNSWLMLDTESYMLQLHPVICDVISHELQPNSLKCRDYVRGVWLLLKDCWWFSEEERKTYYPLLSRLLQLYPEPVAELFTEYSDFVNICWMCGDYEQSKDTAQKLYAFSCREYGTASEQSGLAALHMAGAYLNSGEDIPAEEWYKISFENYKASNAPVSAKMAQACFKIGRCASKHGDYEEAVRYFDEAEKMYEQLIQNGESHPDQYEDLKIARERMFMMQGRYEEAVSLCKSVYDVITRHYGEENTSAAYALGDLGICYSYLRQNDKAEEYLNHALEINIRNNGVKSMTTSYVREAIADHFSRTGDLKNALKQYSVLELDLERDLGSENQHVVRIRNKRQDTERSI